MTGSSGVDVNEEHIFEGKINRSGRAVGFHHRAGGQNPPTARVARIVDPPNAQGLYRAEVEILDPATSSWVAKGSASTFFPDAWAQNQVLSEIDGAFGNPILTRGNYWEGVTPSGLRIGGYLDAAGDINTAFPIY
ncbi:MAG TPA: hypothetical protein DDY78_15690 [Planctomycetales bacterium]|nr:hypothetical protein [Planctomycetales bacterium]